MLELLAMLLHAERKFEQLPEQDALHMPVLPKVQSELQVGPAATHTLLLHTGVLPEQTFPQEPQLFTLLVKSTQDLVLGQYVNPPVHKVVHVFVLLSHVPPGQSKLEQHPSVLALHSPSVQHTPDKHITLQLHCPPPLEAAAQAETPAAIPLQYPPLHKVPHAAGALQLPNPSQTVHVLHKPAMHCATPLEEVHTEPYGQGIALEISQSLFMSYIPIMHLSPLVQQLPSIIMAYDIPDKKMSASISANRLDVTLFY